MDWQELSETPHGDLRDAKAEIERLTAALETARADALREAVEVCTNTAKNYSVMKPCGTIYEPIKVQEAAKGMVRLARQDILALIKKGGDA